MACLINVDVKMKKYVNGVVVELTDSEIEWLKSEEAAYFAKDGERVSEEIRQHRDRLLSDTDWMALSDVTMSAEMTSYRQALRDITGQAGFPYSVTWPTKP